MEEGRAREEEREERRRGIEGRRREGRSERRRKGEDK